MNACNRIYGCWLGKSIGGTLGLPAEGRMERLNFSFYDPVPTVAPPNDDLELQLVWLHMVENAGSALTLSDFAKAWIDHIHYMWDEYGRTRWNLRRGVALESVGTFQNPFHAGMGSPIRSEIWACLFPGDADSAAHYAAMDASMDHGIEGIAGEVLFSAMQSLVAAGDSLAGSITSARKYIPPDCETSVAIQLVLKDHADGVSEWDCWADLLSRHGNENFTHAPLNVALTIWALLYSAEDFEKSILLAVNGGYDTDCTAATVGATLGLLLGKAGIPARWIEPIGEGVFVGPGIKDINAPTTLTELTDRTSALIGRLEAKKWDSAIWGRSPSWVDPGAFPGNVSFFPADGSEPVVWANGEIPVEIKKAGGGHWSWQVTEPGRVICLARQGARLYVDNVLLLECPAGLPYVPATHRSPAGSFVDVNLEAGEHKVCIQLNSDDPAQEASVVFASTDMHLCPWIDVRLPHRAILPAN